MFSKPKKEKSDSTSQKSKKINNFNLAEKASSVDFYLKLILKGVKTGVKPEGQMFRQQEGVGVDSQLGPFMVCPRICWFLHVRLNGCCKFPCGVCQYSVCLCCSLKEDPRTSHFPTEEEAGIEIYIKSHGWMEELTTAALKLVIFFS